MFFVGERWKKVVSVGKRCQTVEKMCFPAADPELSVRFRSHRRKRVVFLPLKGRLRCFHRADVTSYLMGWSAPDS